MKKTTLLLPVNLIIVTLFITLTSCFFDMGQHGPMVEQERNVDEFNKLKVSSGIDVELSQGSHRHVIIKANKDIIDDVETDVANGTLKVNIDRNWFRSNVTVNAEITYEDLNEIELPRFFFTLRIP